MVGKINGIAKAELQQEMLEQGFSPLRCSNCGRFLGYEMIGEGTVFLKCPSCKLWTEVSSTGEGLTNKG